MYKEESFDQNWGQVRPCIIPTESVKIVKLDLGPNENGIVINYEAKQEENLQKERQKPLLEKSTVVPITMRKYILYMESKAG